VRAFFHSTRVFWSASLLAAALALCMSVELGKVLGAGILAHGTAHSAPPPAAASTGAPEVVGGQRHAAAEPGQTSATVVP